MRRERFCRAPVNRVNLIFLSLWPRSGVPKKPGRECCRPVRPGNIALRNDPALAVRGALRLKRPLFILCLHAASLMAAPDPHAPASTVANADWWSLRPLVRPAVPGPGNPIDAFIRARLTENHLSPAPPADPRTLIRRLYFDLHGLPPSPEAVDAFTPGQVATLTDQLLASPRYGERWARHWFDVIHFADSHGFEHDVKRDNAWRYRDYVISALNADTAWPRFIREQLAADVFFPDEPQLTPALGYLGAGTFDMSTFGTTTVTFDYLDRDDMVTQTMATFVSTTANCARCHAHKFDPITQEDYFSLQAVFAGIGKGDISYDEDPATGQQRQRWTALKDAAIRQDSAILLAAENTALVAAWEKERGPAAPRPSGRR